MFYFTLGQRGGLNLGGVRGFAPAPWYVVGKDVAGNNAVRRPGRRQPWLMSTTTWTEPAHWIAGTPPAEAFQCLAQTRYRQPPEPCRVQVAADGRLEVTFQRPQRAVTPGQSLVLYDGDVCLGGAVIEATDAPAGTQPQPLSRYHDRPWIRTTECNGRMMQERVLALAGLAQALKQVRRIAETGQADAAVLGTALQSVLRIDAASAEDVYGGAQNVRPGLRLLHGYFNNLPDDELPKLALAVMQLGAPLHQRRRDGAARAARHRCGQYRSGPPAPPIPRC